MHFIVVHVPGILALFAWKKKYPSFSIFLLLSFYLTFILRRITMERKKDEKKILLHKICAHTHFFLSKILHPYITQAHTHKRTATTEARVRKQHKTTTTFFVFFFSNSYYYHDDDDDDGDDDDDKQMYILFPFEYFLLLFLLVSAARYSTPFLSCKKTKYKWRYLFFVSCLTLHKNFVFSTKEFL